MNKTASMTVWPAHLKPSGSRFGLPVGHYGRPSVRSAQASPVRVASYVPACQPGAGTMQAMEG